jgi:hypothetical protein
VVKVVWRIASGLKVVELKVVMHVHAEAAQNVTVEAEKVLVAALNAAEAVKIVVIALHQPHLFSSF